MEGVTQYLQDFETMMRHKYPSEQDYIAMQLMQKQKLEQEAAAARREYTQTQKEANSNIYAYNAKRREIRAKHDERLNRQNSGIRLVSQEEAQGLAHLISRRTSARPARRSSRTA